MQQEVSAQRKIQHLYLRAGFGIAPAELSQSLQWPLQKHVQQLFEQSKAVENLHVTDRNELKAIRVAAKIALGDDDDKKEMIKDVKEQIKTLNLLWVEQMTRTRAALREKMTLFWHGHFACRSLNPFFVQSQNNTLRRYALGKFPDLLKAVSQDPAMLQFLNNQQNKKGSPNENFARELMELFTLGRGHYTEQDIKEAARAFTGWGFNPEGEFTFRRFFHDTGQKTFMGRSGNFQGEDILQIILEKRQIATFIVGKIYRYFVNEQADEARVNELAQGFYDSGYDIAQLMERIFMADWFYEPQQVGGRIKSPIELLVGMARQTGLQLQSPEPLLFVQKLLGQVLFYPPNVAGWAEGKNWIDSSTLMVRTLLPSVLFRDGDLPVEAKDDGDVNTEHLARRNFRDLKASANWAALAAPWGHLQEAEQAKALAAYLLQNAPSESSLNLAQQHLDRSSPEALAKSLTIHLMSLPEYQLC